MSMSLGQLNLVLCFILLASAKSVDKVTARDKLIASPVIFIPGDGGSQVEARLNKTSVVHYVCEKKTDAYFDLWLNIELLVPVIIDCWVDNMRLIYDNVTRTTRNSPGVDIRIPGFGNSSTVEWLDPSRTSLGAYFKDIGNVLELIGFKRGLSLKGAPYDFRKAPNENKEYFVNLKSLVEQTYYQNGNKPVTLIAHSMGGPMSLQFLNKQEQRWKDKFIRSLVTLSGVWGGSVKALKVYVVGDNLGVFALSESVLREEQRTSPSLAWLMPSALFWNDTEVLVSSDKKNYTVHDFEDFFQDIGFPDGWEMRKDTHPYGIHNTPPGVEVHCLHGFDVSTVERINYKPKKFPDGYPEFEYGNGDGTVNIRSLEGCLQWQGKQKQKVYHQTFPKVDHMAILRDDGVLSYIKQLMGKL